jgi:hypothetical protein
MRCDPATPLPLSLITFPNCIREDANLLLNHLEPPHPQHNYLAGDPNNHMLRCLVNYEDLRTVGRDETLADEVVDGMGFIIATAFPHCWSFSCNMQKLASHGQTGPLLHAADPLVTQNKSIYQAYDYMRVAPYFIDVVPQNHRYLFVPINVGNYHWVLVVCDVQNNRLMGYDPLMKTMDNELGNVERILRDAHILAGPVVKETRTDMPEQRDGTSCGPAIIAYMLALARGVSLPPLSSRTIDTLREFTACSILSNSLGDTEGFSTVARTGVENRSHSEFIKGVHAELPMNALQLTNAEATSRPQDPNDPTRQMYSRQVSGHWVRGFVPGQEVPFDYVMYAPMEEADCLTFTDGERHVGHSYFQWGAKLMSSPSSPQPNQSDMDELVALLRGIPNRTESEQELLRKLQLPEYRTSMDRIRTMFPWVQSIAREDQQQARLMRQIFKYIFYLTMFYRRWRGPGHPLPLSAAATRSSVTSASELSQNIPTNLRRVDNGRAAGIDAAMIGVMYKLANKTRPEVLNALHQLPLLDIVLGTNGLPVPFPLRRVTVTNDRRNLVMTTLWRVFELTSQGHSCVRETSHLVARTANFYFALVTGFPLVPFHDLDRMGPVV